MSFLDLEESLSRLAVQRAEDDPEAHVKLEVMVLEVTRGIQGRLEKGWLLWDGEKVFYKYSGDPD